MQNFANSIIRIVSGQENGAILVFLTIVCLIAFINNALIFSLKKKYSKTYIPEIAITKRKVIGCIITMLLCITLVWLPFDWTKVVSRIIFICFVLYPIFPFVFNRSYYCDPCILLTIASAFYLLISSDSGMIDPFWNRFFILINILIFFLFISCYCVVLGRNFVRNIVMLSRENGDSLESSKKPYKSLFYISKIGLIASIVLSYVVIVYSGNYFSDNFEKVFCFIAEAIMIPNIITLLLEIKSK